MYAEQKWNCGLCSKIMGTESGLVYHLLTTHNALKEFIPNKESFTQESQNENDFEKIAETNDKRDSDKKITMCPICKAENSSKTNLFRHMAMRHFR